MSHECDCHTELEQYAHELRRLRASHRRVCMALVVVPCLYLLGSAVPLRTEVPDVVEAHRFVLLDSKGGMSAMLSVDEDDEHRTGSATLQFVSDLGMAVGLSSGHGNPSLIMNGGGNYVAEGRLGHLWLGSNAKVGPYVDLWSQVAPSAASQGGKTMIRTPWADNPKSIEVVKGATTAWVAPPQQ